MGSQSLHMTQLTTGSGSLMLASGTGMPIKQPFPYSDLASSIIKSSFEYICSSITKLSYKCIASFITKSRYEYSPLLHEHQSVDSFILPNADIALLAVETDTVSILCSHSNRYMMKKLGVVKRITRASPNGDKGYPFPLPPIYR